MQKTVNFILQVLTRNSKPEFRVLLVVQPFTAVTIKIDIFDIDYFVGGQSPPLFRPSEPFSQLDQQSAMSCCSADEDDGISLAYESLGYVEVRDISKCVDTTCAPQ